MYLAHSQLDWNLTSPAIVGEVDGSELSVVESSVWKPGVSAVAGCLDFSGHCATIGPGLSALPNNRADD